jgi:Tol biopolymer transport system component
MASGGGSTVHAPGCSRAVTKRIGLLATALLVCALTGATTAHAADPLSVDAAIGRGVTQLEGVQLPDGSLGGRLPVRDSATAGEALRLARPASPAIPRIDAFLSPLALGDVDDLARTALGAPSGGSASALIAEQNDDGGFGLSGQYQSDALDTALALRALTALGERDAARRAADRLLKFSNAGVWGADGGDVSLTSEALLALDAYIARYGSSSAIDTSLGGAIAWLGTSQQDDGSWSPGGLSVRSTALGVAALASSPAPIARVGSGADALLRAQLPDGSWGDPFSTALAIRALRLAGDAIERDRVAQLPDPSVEARDLSANPPLVDAGSPITITAKVSNTGMATASGVTAEFFLDDPASGAAPVATANVPDLAPAAQASVDGTFSVNIARPRTRVYAVLRAPVGHDRDLGNNSAFINIYVRGAHKSYMPTRDWPRPGRDVQHSGTTPNHLHPGIDPAPIWRTRADGGQTVAEGKVFFGDGSNLEAVDAQTGALAWRHDHTIYYGTDDRYRAPLYNRGYVFSANPGTAGAVVAKTGEYQYYGIGGWGGDIPVWGVDLIPQEHGHDPVFMYLATYEFINQDGQHCHIAPYSDPSATPWNDFMWRGSSPMFPSAGIGQMILNHRCDGQQLAFASDGPRGFFSSGGYLTGFNAATGVGPNGEPDTALFDVKLPGLVRAPAAPLVDSLGQVITAGWEGSWPADKDPTQIATTGRGRVVASDPTDGSTYWSFTTDTRLDGSPVEYGGAIVVVDRSGKVYALDQTTGALKWSWRPDGYVPPAPDQQGKSGQTLALSGHYLYVPHPDGNIYTLDARDGSQLSATAFGGRPYDLAIDDTNNAIYVRTLDGYVGAYPTRELATQCGPDGTNAPPAPGDITRESFNPDGSQLTGSGATFARPAISANGRYIAYVPASGQIYVRDLQTGQTTAVPAFDQVNSNTQRLRKQSPVLSADGRYLGYVAETISPQGDFNAMYVLDLQTGVTEPVLKNPDGSAQNVELGGTSNPTDLANSPIAMSDDGQTVAFSSWTNGIVPGDNNGRRDVFLVNRATGARTQVSPVTPAAQQVDNANPALSRDGRYVAFTSNADLTGTPLAPGHYDSGQPYTYLYDVATGQLRPVSINGEGQLVQGYSPYVSGDGRFVTFSSLAPSLLPAFMRNPDWYGYSVDAFLFDRTTGSVDLASVTDAGEHNRVALALHAGVSDDGRYVAFQNTGLFVKGSTVYDQPQVIARDRTAGTTEQISHNSWGVSGLGTSLAPALSADGTRIAFISTASDLVDGDTNNARDVFVYDRSRSGAAPAPGDPPPPGSCPPPSGGGTPSYSDLSVAADDIQPSALEQGQSGQVDVTVHNSGGGASEATTVRLYDGDPGHGTLIGEQSLGQLAAGATTKLSFAWDPVAAAGQHTLTAVVDPDRKVFEQNLANDEAGKSSDVVAPRLDLSVAPDKQAYGANEAVDFAAHLTNSSLAARDVRLVMSIRDPDGSEVAAVHDGHVQLAPSGDAVVHDGWNTSDTTPGRYTVSARLLNAVGDEVASTNSSLDIKPDVAAGLSLETDQLSYDSGATATIGALVSNRSANSTLSGAHVQLSLSDPGGVALDHWDLPAGDVMQGRSALLNQGKPLHGLAPGTYHAAAKLLASDGAQLAQGATDFAVRSSADSGDGVSGSLTASPTDPRRYMSETLRYSVTDSGNADIPGATVRVRISDLSSGQTLKTLDDPRTITRGAPATGSVSTMVDMAENRDYQASLHLVLADGSERPLDRAIIHVRPQQLLYGASFDTSPHNRVLVWACDRADDAAARTALGNTFATYVPDRSDPRYSTEPGCGKYGAEEQQRFMSLLRSGTYNQFWLVGRHHPLERSVADELGARVLQGDGLLVAGGDSGSDLFSQAGNLSPLGASFAGTAPTGSYTLQFAPGSAFAGLDAQVTSAPVKVTTTQATAVGTTSWGTGSNAKTAITATYNQFWAGKAIFIGAPPSSFVDNARSAAVLRSAADVLLPFAAPARAGGMARLDLFIEGEAPGSPLELRTQLPAGMGVGQLAADATLTGSLLTLPFDAAGTQRKVRSAWLRLPTGAPSATTTSTVHYRDAGDGQTKQYGPPASASIDITETRQTAHDAALTGLNFLFNLSNGDQAQVQKIRDDVNAAMSPTTGTTVLWNRLRALLDDVGTLQRSHWLNAFFAEMPIAHLATYVEYDYYLAGGK